MFYVGVFAAKGSLSIKYCVLKGSACLARLRTTPNPSSAHARGFALANILLKISPKYDSAISFLLLKALKPFFQASGVAFSPRCLNKCLRLVGVLKSQPQQDIHLMKAKSKSCGRLNAT
jgi:hypothetical protein